MTTWAELDTITAHLLDDTGGMYYTTGTTGSIRRELEYGELLCSLMRGFSEATVDLTLTLGTAIYNPFTVVSDFIAPLRVSLNSVPLRKTELSSLSRLDSDFLVTAGTPSLWYVVGTNLLGFYPVPDATYVTNLTYQQVPPTGSSGSPVIPQEFVPDLPEYAAGILLASEGKLPEAVEHMKTFMERMGIKRDYRFLRGASRKKPETALVQQPESQD